MLGWHKELLSTESNQTGSPSVRISQSLTVSESPSALDLKVEEWESSSVVNSGSSICLGVTKLQSISQKMVSMDPTRAGFSLDSRALANMSRIHSEQLLLTHSQSLLPLNLMLHFTRICYFTF